MVRFFLLAWENPENSGGLPLVHHVPQNHGTGGTVGKGNLLYDKMWGSGTAYRDRIGGPFSFFAKRILQKKKYFVTFFRRVFSKVFARWESRYYNRL